MGGYDARARAAQLMHGLGFDHTEDERPIRSFSGGWRVRINVARALMCRSDLLLLDEPTNHLDIDAILWLEGWLRDYPGTLLLIAHDREFLDRVCNRIVNIEHGEAHAYRGNYSAFETQRAAELAEQSALYARQQREIRHMESFVERFRAKATKARQAQSRLKALERMQRIAPAHVDSARSSSRSPTPAKLPRPLLAIEDQSVGYGGRTLLQHVKLTLDARRSAGAAGPQWRRQIDLHETAGRRAARRAAARAPRRAICSIGYFAQHQLEQLAADESPLENLRRTGGARAKRHDRSGAARLPGDLRLSRRSRVRAGRAVFRRREGAPGAGAGGLSATEPVAARRADQSPGPGDAPGAGRGAAGIPGRGGAGLARPASAQHGGRRTDRRARRAAVRFDGDLEDYAQWLASGGPVRAINDGAAIDPSAAALAVQPAAIVDSAAQRRQRRREEAEARGRIAPLRATVQKHEKLLEQLARERTALEQQLAAPGLYLPEERTKLQAALARQAELARLQSQAEAEWLVASSALEQHSRSG